jgi:hypothetical protein
MTPSDPDAEPERGEPERPRVEGTELAQEAVDSAFAAIIAEWGETPAAPGSGRAAEDLDELPEPRPDGPLIPAIPPYGPAPESPIGDLLAGDLIGSDDAAEATQRFVPPDPPPLLTGDLAVRLAWAAVLAGPAFLLFAAVAWHTAPKILVLLGVVAFVAGFVALVVRMPQERDENDDGAVV